MFRLEKKKKYFRLGFTLIELIIVIVILSLLAVFAIPRYLHVRSEARKVAILGVEASMQSALVLVMLKAKLDGVLPLYGETITLEKGRGGLATVRLTERSVPTATGSMTGWGPGMADAFDLQDTQGVVVGPYNDVDWPTWGVRSLYYYAAGSYSPPGAPGNCGVIYSERLWSMAEGPAGSVYFTTDVTGC